MVRLSHSNWRRLLGCVLAYALVLQAFIFALDVGQSAIAAAQDPVWPASNFAATVPAAQPGLMPLLTFRPVTRIAFSALSVASTSIVRLPGAAIR